MLLADPMELALDAYRNIVSQADSYDYSGGYGEPNPPDATYYYTLVPMSAGSDIPALLLSSYNEFFGLNYIRRYLFLTRGHKETQDAQYEQEFILPSHPF